MGERELHRTAWDQIGKLRLETGARSDEPLAYVITRQRLKCADCLLAEVYEAPAERRVSLTERLGHLMVHPLWGWPFLALVLLGLYYFVGVFLIGFLRRDFGAAGLFSLARDGFLTTNQLVVSLVVITLFIPCIANLLMIVREHGRRTAVWVAATVFPLAFGVGALLSQLIRWLGIQF